MSRDRLSVVITGGNRSIGAAVARLAPTRGYDVAVSFMCRIAVSKKYPLHLAGVGTTAGIAAAVRHLP
jgi:NAD(P)-dependent dehydrogenase (short-subunit alcohol dehydrogenase family)